MTNIYKHIINTSPIGYAYYKLINNSQGSPIDYVCEEMNHVFADACGLSALDNIGKKGKQVLGELDLQLLAILKDKPEQVISGFKCEITVSFNTYMRNQQMKVEFLDEGYFIIQIDNNLNKTVNRYKELFDDAPIAMASVSLDGKFLEINNLFCKILDYDKETLIKMNVKELTYGDDLSVSESSFNNLKEDKQLTVELEKRYIDSKGFIVWVELSAKLIKDFKGDPIKVVITISDITGKKNAERQLQKSEEKFKALFNTAPLSYHSLDAKGFLVDVNEQWLQMLGYKSEEVLGKWFGEFISPAYIDKYRTTFPIFKKQGYINCNLEMVHKDGSILFVELDGKIGADQSGGFKQTHCMLKDITKQRELEKALSKNSHLMNSLMDNTPDIIYIKNTQGKYMFFNKAAEKFSGKNASDILGKGVDAVFPVHVAQELTARDKEIFEHKEIITSEEIVLGTSGNFRTFLSTKGPILDENNELIGMFGISRDINDRVQWEKELYESEKKYRWITENVADVISVYNITNDMYSFISPSVSNLLGISIEEAMARTAIDSIAPQDIEFFVKSMKEHLEEFIKSPNTNKHYTNEVQLLTKGGGKIWTEISTRYQYNERQEIESVNIIRNIEERKKSEEIMRRLSYYDQLTGLYNRRFYEEELKRLDTERNLPLTLIMADLNGLKLANDAFGHQEGDRRLIKIADILKRGCRADEILSRIGGDEFVILMPKTNAESARSLIKRINEAVSNEKVEHGILSLSIGYAVKEKATDKMHEVFKKAEDDMYRHKLAESSSMRSKTINLIMNSLFEKSKREMLHSNRVSMICKAIATKMDFSQEDINQTKIAALVHDIGKIGISNNILDKKGALTNEEWEEIKRHCEVGYRILSSVNEFSEIAEFVLSHQEKWNGEGYPQGLKGEEIPVQSRIIAVADAFDAMTSDRSYRTGISEEEAVKEIRKCSGSHFDPFIASIFVEQVLPNMVSNEKDK